MSNLRLRDPVFGDDFESALRRFFSPTVFDRDEQRLQMKIDVSENAGSYLVKADIPGVKKEDINIRIDGNMVQIDAEIRKEKDTKGAGDKVLRSERYCGAISRAFSLGQDVDDTKAQAKYADGVLTLELPKKATASARKVTVQ
jgi:Molecular chaperone (small heat shock protein)